MATLQKRFAKARLTADQRRMLKRYLQLRRAIGRVGSRMVEMLPTDAFKRSAKDLGMLVDGEIVGESEAERDILRDYALYGYRPTSTAQSMVERFASPSFDREAATLDEDEAAMRRYMANSRFMIVELRDVVPGFAVHLDDGLWGSRSMPLIDVAMSRTADAGMVCAGWILEAEGFWMSSGVLVPMDPETVASVIAELVCRYGERLYRPDLLGPARRSDIARHALRICLAHGMADHMRIRYLPD